MARGTVQTLGPVRFECMGCGPSLAGQTLTRGPRDYCGPVSEWSCRPDSHACVVSRARLPVESLACETTPARLVSEGFRWDVHMYALVSQPTPAWIAFSIPVRDTGSDPRWGWLGLACETNACMCSPDLRSFHNERNDLGFVGV